MRKLAVKWTKLTMKCVHKIQNIILLCFNFIIISRLLPKITKFFGKYLSNAKYLLFLQKWTPEMTHPNSHVWIKLPGFILDILIRGCVKIIQVNVKNRIYVYIRKIYYLENIRIMPGFLSIVFLLLIWIVFWSIILII